MSFSTTWEVDPEGDVGCGHSEGRRMGFVRCAGMLIIEENDDGMGVFADLTTEEPGIACSGEIVDVSKIVVKSVAVTITTASAITANQNVMSAVIKFRVCSLIYLTGLEHEDVYIRIWNKSIVQYVSENREMCCCCTM